MIRRRLRSLRCLRPSSVAASNLGQGLLDLVAVLNLKAPCMRYFDGQHERPSNYGNKVRLGRAHATDGLPTKSIWNPDVFIVFSGNVGSGYVDGLRAF